ncbi:rod-binding protein [Sulfitobacter sp. HNIBRBA2951]|uniref:rod-binding protein n=1 Tax=Sulfitobacter aquimarinus TaxID=3158557 RepID=UPI0032DF14F4
MNPIPPPQGVPAPLAPRDRALMDAARSLEAAFLSEMLQSAGLGKTSAEFGGGAGEDQFSSFLVSEQAKHIVKGGGIGLAQSLFEALKEQNHDA